MVVTKKDENLDRDFDALKSEATTWIVRLTSGAATAADADALKRWRATSSAHEKAFREAALVWNTLGPALDQRLDPARTVLTRRRVLFAGGLAASSAGVTVALSALGILPSLDMMLADYSTAIGEQRTFRLPDGSTATLDGGTALSINFSENVRRATLTTGAAVFDVTQDPARPFRVSAGSGETTGPGASFTIKLGVEDVSVECLRGRIEVECLGSSDLDAGEAVRYSQYGLSAKEKTGVETAAAWRKGLLIFNNRSLADVVSDLNRHRKGKVIIASSAIGGHRVSGVFHLDRPEEILAHLEATMQTRPVSLPGGVVLLL